MITKEQQATIEKRWLARAEAQELKPNTMAYKRAEVEFFAGAMTALEALAPCPEDKMQHSPPIWVINIVSGRPVVDRSKVTP